MTTPGVTAQAPQPPARLHAPTPRVALVIFAVVVLGVVLYLGRSALTPFIIGALLIYVLDPLVGLIARLRIGRFKMPRGLAVLIVYALTFFVVFEAVVLLLVPLISQVGQFAGDLPRIVQALEGAFAQLSAFYQTLDLPPAVREYIDGMLADLGEDGPAIDLGALLPLAQTLLGTVASFFGWLIVPFWAFYILRDRLKLRAKLYSALPPAWRHDTQAVLHIVDRVLGRWIRAQLLLGLIIGGATYLGLLVLGWVIDERFLQFAVLLAVVAGVLSLLPIIGPIISMVPTLLISLTTAEPLLALIATVALYTAVQQVEGAFLVPKIQGTAVELHPSVIIFALIMGGAIAGLVGAILSVPITAVTLAVYRYLFRRLSADDPAVPPPDAPDMQALVGDGEEPAVRQAKVPEEADAQVEEAEEANDAPGEAEQDARDRQRPVDEA
ncbi:MAG TPA: AI-2E family transporter [Candidatus Limnocylindria bacterium]|nr:AI-2E family transporter [Candidatus Limnocylindria bacterium]